jgi:4-aminobutyrate aminotransferase
MWAIEQEGVAPDIITAGKGIASGLPLGAMMARDDLMKWELGSHGSTYGGSPISCAAALATFDVIEGEGLLENARRVGEVFLEGCRAIAERHPIVKDVRGRALWIGLSFEDHHQAIAVEQTSFGKGLLMLGCGDDAIRISPALNFREDQARASLEIFEEAIAQVESAGS